MPPGVIQSQTAKWMWGMHMFMTDLPGDDGAPLENGHIRDAERSLYTVLWQIYGGL